MGGEGRRHARPTRRASPTPARRQGGRPSAHVRARERARRLLVAGPPRRSTRPRRPRRGRSAPCGGPADPLAQPRASCTPALTGRRRVRQALFASPRAPRAVRPRRARAAAVSVTRCEAHGQRSRAIVSCYDPLLRKAVAALRLCEQLPALVGVPTETHRIETVDGPLKECLVFADGADGPQRERLEVGARL